MLTLIGETRIDEGSNLVDTYYRCDQNDAQRFRLAKGLQPSLNRSACRAVWRILRRDE
ncbi:hypothetical protein [Streptomyces sp. NBC_00353]|uniref:hypothetical protein n=1 Tax=unclassified Streptomyces TaxID=2593676 RepID=UPI002E2556CA